MPPNRKPTVSEHSAATWVVWSAGIVAALAATWAVLWGTILLCREGTGVIARVDGLDGFCVAVTLLLAAVVLVVIIGIVIGAIVAAWDWTAWAYRSKPDREPDGFDSEDGS